MRWPGPIDAQWLRRWTIRLGVAAWVVLALPVLTVLCLISFIGIPLGLAMMAVPTLFELVALAYVMQRLIGRDTRPAIAASFALALALLGAVASLCNARLDRRAAEFLAGDMDTLERPLRAKAIGLVDVDSHFFSKGETRCLELCQRLLLSGAADRVIVPAVWSVDGAWTAATPALAYRFEQREACPPVQIPGHVRDPRVDDAKPDETMRLVIASGRCLVEEQATFADSEVVVATGRIRRGARQLDAGLSLTADTVTVDRASVYLRGQAGFEERYRWSGVTVLPHPPIPIPTLVGGVELNMEPGFLRNEEKRNIREFARDSVHPVRFVRDELGLDVGIPAPTAALSLPGLITRGLDSPGPLAPAIRQVIEDFFASLRDAKQIDEATRLLAFRALDDPRVPAPRETWALVRACEKAGDAVNSELGDILFRKLMATDPRQKEDHPSYLGYLAGYLANSIHMLPANAVRTHRRELEEIARDPARRWRAYRALEQLSAFGADAVPTMLFLVDAGVALKNANDGTNSRDREDWQGPYRSGLVGLCQLGDQGSSALAPLLERLRAGELPTTRSSDELLLTALVRIGADPETLRGYFATDDSSASRFDRDVERARSRPECHL